MAARSLDVISGLGGGRQARAPDPAALLFNALYIAPEMVHRNINIATHQCSQDKSDNPPLVVSTH
jgi:hypothetical protein